MSDYGAVFYERNLKFQTALADALVPYITKKIKFSSIADFGCGCGHFLSSLAYDVSSSDFVGLNLEAPRNMKIPKERFVPADFSKAIDLEKKFDLVISLEVAEHIPASSADTFVFSLVRHASKYIMFSAATPGQGGVGHINEQPHEYWHNQFFKHGFSVNDCIRRNLAKHPKVPFWYRNNIFLYERLEGK